MIYSRRDVGKIALASLPLASAFAKVDSKINGVQIGVITYSFRGMNDAEEILKAIVKIGLSSVELMSNHAEQMAGAPSQGGGRGPGGRGPGAPAPAPSSAPPGGGRGPGGGGRGRGQTPEQIAAAQARAEELRKWRTSVSMDKFKDVRKRFTSEGIDLRLLCFNMRDNNTDDEIEYDF